MRRPPESIVILYILYIVRTRCMVTGGDICPLCAIRIGWSVIEAPDVEAAKKLLSDHPFIGRGGVLQINEPVEF